jgi:hypothetical protein
MRGKIFIHFSLFLEQENIFYFLFLKENLNYNPVIFIGTDHEHNLRSLRLRLDLIFSIEYWLIEC